MIEIRLDKLSDKSMVSAENSLLKPIDSPCPAAKVLVSRDSQEFVTL